MNLTCQAQGLGNIEGLVLERLGSATFDEIGEDGRYLSCTS